MDATTLFIVLLAAGALFYLFGGSFRRRSSSTEIENEGASGNGGGGCCGGHSHAGHGPHKKPVDVEAWVDPVCGMPVETKQAAAIKRYKGTTFYFCSQRCRAAFARNPRKYIKKEELERQTVHSRGGGHGCCG